MKKLTDEQKNRILEVFIHGDAMDELFEYLSLNGWEDEEIDAIAEKIEVAIRKVGDGL